MILTPKHPFIALSGELAELCKPLEAFHIHHFTYQKQFNDGTRVSLSNKPQWIEDYYNLKLYESSLFEEKPSTYKAGFNIWMNDYDLPVYHHGKLYYNTSHCISITEPHHDGCEHYLFSTAPDKPQAIHYLANNLDILYHFIAYLKDHAVDSFKKASKKRIVVQKSFIPAQANSLGLSSKNDFYEKLQEHKKRFFRHTPVRRYAFEVGDLQGIKLAQREIMCVVYLLQDKTAREIAEEMNLSLRTVESYIDNIKVKMGCESKAELLRKVRANKYLVSLRDTAAA